MIKGLAPKEKDYVITEKSDERGAGRLQIKVYPSGIISFQFQYYIDKKRRRIEIGKYPLFSLADARKRFYQLSESVALGHDPMVEKGVSQAEQKLLNSLATMHELITEFIEYGETEFAASTMKRLVNCFNHDLTPFITDELSINDFIEQDLARELIYKVYNRGAIHQADIFRSNLMSMFKFAIDYDNSPARYKLPNRYGQKINPIRDINIQVPTNANKRWLNEEEIKKIWHADDLPFIAQQYFRLALALGGQRIEEVYKSYAHEYNFEDNTLTIPRERIKVRDRGDHVVPISPLAVEILQEILPHRGSTGALFPHRDDPTKPAHHNTISIAYARWCKKHSMPSFSPKVLRSTCKTLMTKAGVPIHIRDILQQHNKRDVATVHYDRYDYLSEKIDGIGVWDKYLMKIIHETG